MADSAPKILDKWAIGIIVEVTENVTNRGPKK
jgi:hypothetical protein